MGWLGGSKCWVGDLLGLWGGWDAVVAVCFPVLGGCVAGVVGWLG